MPILRQIKRLQFIDFIIKKRATGSLENFAQKNRMSKRGLANILQEMKEMGFPIKYSRQIKSYFYEEDGQMVKCLFIRDGEPLQRHEVREIKAATNLCFSVKSVFEVCDDGRNSDEKL